MFPAMHSGNERVMVSLLARVMAVIVLLRALRDRRSQQRRVASSQTTKRPAPPAAPSTTRGRTQPSQPSHEPVETPLDLEKHDYHQTLKRTLKEVKEDRIPLIAGGMAYYAFLAIFPAVIAAIGILGLVGGDSSRLADGIRDALPAGIGDTIADAVAASDRPEQGASLTAAIVGIAVALYSASSGFVGLQGGLNVAYDIAEDRKFLAKRGTALVLILATLLFGGVPSPLFFFGDNIILAALGWIVTVVAVVLLFSIYYALGPRRETSWRWVSPGGLIGAALWIVASVAFALYVDNFSSYGRTYGALAGVVVLILWLYLSSLAILIGGEINSELERQANIKNQRS